MNSPRLLSLQRGAWVAAILGMGALAVGAAFSPTRVLQSILTNGVFFLTLAAGATVLLALFNVANSGWSAVLKRVLESFSSYLPFGAGVLMLLLLGLPSLYLWARPGVMETDHLLHTKHAFLNPTFFAIRMVVMFGIWIFFAWKLRRNSLEQDRTASVDATRRNTVLSAVFLCVFALTWCLAAFDWIMSLEPHWFSTIFGLYNGAGLLSSTVSAVAIAAILLKRAGLLPELQTAHVHDLAKLMFGFATFWAYLWFSQFLLIWYSNLPEETVYFLARMHGAWAPLFYANLLLNWALPFVLLLPRPAKRNELVVMAVGALLLVGRWVDLHVMIGPANSPSSSLPGAWDLAGFVGIAGLFVVAVTRAVRSAPLIAHNDPYIGESLHHH